MNDVIRGIMNFAATLITGTRLVFGCTRRARSGFGPQLGLSAYALAAIAVGGAVVATLGLGSAIKHTPTLFFCSVIFGSWLGGLGAGIFSILLTGLT